VRNAAPSDDADVLTSFRPGDTVRRRDNDETCLVIWAWRDWLWLDPVDYSDAAPFTDRIYEYELARRGWS
jgi:hypothetical protein